MIEPAIKETYRFFVESRRLPIWIAFLLCFFLVSFEIFAADPDWTAVLNEPAGMVREDLPLRDGDLSLEWAPSAVSDASVIRARVEPSSIEWLRIQESTLIPRAMALIDLPEGGSGTIEYLGKYHPWGESPGTTQVRVPMVLLTGPDSVLKVSGTRSGGKTFQGELRLKFQSKNASAISRIIVDHTCSPFSIRASAQSLPANQWMYLGCRQVFSSVQGARVPILELVAVWERGGGSENPGSILRWRLSPNQDRIAIRNGTSEVQIAYKLPQKFYFGTLGIGIGPYLTHSIRPNESAKNAAVPIATIYGNYRLSNDSRMTFFDATQVGTGYFSDFGVYYNSETARLFDRAMSVYLLLGAHGLHFNSGSKNELKFGIPQGLEVVSRDFLRRGKNLGFGAFIYPLIDGKAYYNGWIRWGGASMFVELNYIFWRETSSSSEVSSSRSVGVSLGFPFWHFL